MVGAGAGSMGSSGPDASQIATMAKQSQGSGASTVPPDKNLNILRLLLKKLRTLYSDEDDDGITITTEDIAEAVRAFNAHNKAWKEMQTMKSPIEERMLALEEAVKKSLAEPARNAAPIISGPPAPRTYASVAAPPMAKTAVRIRVEGAKDMQPAQLLMRAQKHIPGAYAVRQMRSNDTEVFVQSATQRDVALNMAEIEDFQVLRQDFPVEVYGVPLRTKIEGGKYANNTTLIREMESSTAVRIPGLKINKIRWMHDGKEIERAKTNGRTRGSIVLSLPTEVLQKQVVRHGIVINAMLYSAQVWSPRAQAKQCYNCSQWGHTQASCGKAARCGECAGAHQTRDCPRKRVSCVNCGKEHRSWQRASCRTFQAYKGSVQKARFELLERTAEIRRETSPIIVSQTASATTDDQGFTLVTNRKVEPQKRGPGRPRKVIADSTAVLNTLRAMTPAVPTIPSSKRGEQDGVRNLPNFS